MRYKNFSKLGIEASVLGLGTMRLPVITPNGAIDEPKAINLIRRAIDKGINYVDTAYMYHNGESEKIVGKALQDGYRKKVLLADKMPMWEVSKYEDLDKIFNEQLNRLQTDNIDFYLIHNINSQVWNAVKKYDFFSWIEQKRNQGLIKYIGFSFHHTYELFEKVIKAYDWDFYQIQYNYANEDYQAGTKGFKLAEKLEIPAIIMEPLLGGSLVNLPDNVLTQWNQKKVDHISTALQWLWEKNNTYIVLSGMSNIQQLDKNIEFANTLSTISLNKGQKDLIKITLNALNNESLIKCTNCKYCIDCPKSIDIPYIFELYNNHLRSKHTDNQASKTIYTMLENDELANNCIECKKCEQHCPQGIKIIDSLKKAHSEMGI